MIHECSKLERLNIANNKINNDTFARIVNTLARAPNLKLLQCRHNAIESSAIEMLTKQLKSENNETILFVELAGNKVKKETIQGLEQVLKKNRQSNPISKDKILMAGSMANDTGPSYSRKTNVI